MRAVLMERGRIWLDTVRDPTPRTGEVLVKSLACGICGSDLHAARHTDDFVATSRAVGGAFQLTTFKPVVLGHEFCAEVVDYGPDTPRTFAPGTRVCSVPVVIRKDAMVPVGYSDELPGGFGEYMVLSTHLVTPVPNDVSPRHAALTEPMAVGLHAVNLARLTGDETIVIVGAGPVGLAVLMHLKARRCTPIVVSEPSEARRRLAARLGADVLVDPTRDNPYRRPEVVNRRDVVFFECVGVRGMIDQVFAGAPRHSRLVIVGVCLQTDHSRPLVAINKELNVQYVLGYTLDEFKHTLGLIAEGKLDVAPVITHAVGLSQVAEAFEALAQPSAFGKVLVDPST
jgi:2-desacetyl-2-hydroxyethyl bacteriochlorophyllide A dehydrogenase